MEVQPNRPPRRPAEVSSRTKRQRLLDALKYAGDPDGVGVWKLTPGEKSVLTALEYFMGAEAETCQPQAKHLRARTGLAERSVRRCVERLRLLGLVEVEVRRDDSGDFRSNVYRIRFDRVEATAGWGPNGPRGGAIRSPGVGPSGPQGGAIMAPGGDVMAPPGAVRSPPTCGRAFFENKNENTPDNRADVCVEFVRRFHEGLHGYDRSLGPIFDRQPEPKELEFAREFLDTLGGDGAKLLAMVGSIVEYVRKNFPACVKLTGAADPIRKFLTTRIEHEDRERDRESKKAAEADEKARRDAQAVADRETDAFILGEFLKLPPTSQRHWLDEARRLHPHRVNVRDGPLSIEQAAADEWWDREGRDQ
jgi:DNA-binding MarR family transcriptional regulator